VSCELDQIGSAASNAKDIRVAGIVRHPSVGARSIVDSKQARFPDAVVATEPFGLVELEEMLAVVPAVGPTGARDRVLSLAWLGRISSMIAQPLSTGRRSPRYSRSPLTDTPPISRPLSFEAIRAAPDSDRAGFAIQAIGLGAAEHIAGPGVPRTGWTERLGSRQSIPSIDQEHASC
jgi:hypothetical protein